MWIALYIVMLIILPVVTWKWRYQRASAHFWEDLWRKDAETINEQKVVIGGQKRKILSIQAENRGLTQRLEILESGEAKEDRTRSKS